MEQGTWAVCLAALLAICVSAGPVSSSGIVFKKAKPAGSSKRIDVQIAPEDDWYKRTHREKMEREKAGADNGIVKAEPVVALPRTDAHAWFWDTVSPALSAAAFDRMERAVLTLSSNPAHSAGLSPRISTYQKLADRHGSDILLATLGKEISPALVLAVMGVESSGRADAQSSAGAVGLMQLMSATADRFDVKDRTDPAQSIRGGAAYLEWLLKEFQGDALLALAGYNAGENAVKKHGGVPPYPETRAYVPKVIAAWQVARALCMTPPKYPTDGCVFKKGSKK